MRKKAKKNTISDPPSHPPSFRALLPFRRAVVEELGLELGLPNLPFTLSLPFKEFSSLVVEGDVGSELAIVGVDIIITVVEGLTRVVLEVVALGVVRIVVEGLMRVVPEVATFGVVGIVVEGLTRAVPEVATLGVVGIVVEGLTTAVLDVVALGVVGTVVGELTRVVLEAAAREVVEAAPGIDMVLVLMSTFRQGLLAPWQAYPASQHESKHWVDPAPHPPEHLALGRH